MPGGYDFAVAAFYDGIGAVGFAYGAAKPADIGPAPLDDPAAARRSSDLRDTHPPSASRRRCPATTATSPRR